MADDLIWATRDRRFGIDTRDQARHDWMLVRLATGLDEAEFAGRLNAILPHRAITDAHVRAWERGTTPPPGDVVWAGLRLAGMNLGEHLSHHAMVTPNENGVGPMPRLPGRAIALPAGVALDIERTGPAVDGHHRVDARLLQDLAMLTHQYGGLNDTIAPTSLMPVVRGHYGLLQKLFSSPSPPDLRDRLGVIVGETAMLLGWLSFLVDDRRCARAYWNSAQELADELEDEALCAHVLIARSSLCSSLPHGGRGGDPDLALSLLNEAEARCARTPLLRAWLFARRAEEHAAAGLRRESGADLSAAERELDQATETEHVLLGPRTQLDLAGFRGNCAVLLRRDREAVDVLHSAVEAAPASRTTFRAVLLTDLGAAMARLGEVEAACSAFEQSLDLATEAGATVHAERVAGAAQRLRRWSDAPTVRHLRERLQRLA